MTLILAYIDSNKVVQVVDMRLTYPDGTVADDSSVKAIVLECRDAVLSIAYTGLAEVTSDQILERTAVETTLLAAKLRAGHLRPTAGKLTVHTDTWITHILEAIDAPNLTRVEVCRKLADLTAELFVETRRLTSAPRCRTSLTILVSGFEGGYPVSVAVSNVRNEHSYLPEVDDAFYVTRLSSHESWTQGHRQILIEGSSGAVVDTVDRRLGSSRKRLAREGNRESVLRLAGLIRGASRHPDLGNLIGRNCVGVVIRSSGESDSWSIPFDNNPTQYLPHHVGAGISIADSRITAEPVEPGEIIRQWFGPEEFV